MSKGSSPRPFSVTQQEYDTRWDAIFQRDIREIEDAKNEDEAFQIAEMQQKMRNRLTDKDSVLE
jgi:hypothetical protein